MIVERSPEHCYIEIHPVAADEPGYVAVAARQVEVGFEVVVDVVSSQYGSFDWNRVRISLVDALDRRDRRIARK